jgi:hypothetical protein
MKLGILLSVVVTLVLSSSAPASDYSSLVDRGYRWVSVNGPYACHTEPGAEQLTKGRADARDPNVVQNIWCYYLLPGTIVQIMKEDRARGMSQMRLAGVPTLLWTSSRFLSRRPIQDLYGMIETPESSGLASSAARTGASPLPAGGSSSSRAGH